MVNLLGRFTVFIIVFFLVFPYNDCTDSYAKDCFMAYGFRCIASHVMRPG